MSNIKLSDALCQSGVSKKTNILNLIIANVFIIAGIVLFIVASGNTPMLIGGVCALAIGLFICLKYNTKIVHNASGKTLKETSKYIRYCDIENIISFIKKEGIDMKCDLKHDGSGDYRIDIVMTNDNTFVRGMFFQYVPYNYNVASESFELSREQAIKLLAHIG